MAADHDEDLAEAAGQEAMDAAKQHGRPLKHESSDGEA